MAQDHLSLARKHYIMVASMSFTFQGKRLIIYIAAWQIMHGSEQFFEKNNGPIATHPDADADLQSQTVRLAIIYIKCIIQTAYKRHKKGIKGCSPELQRKRADVLLNPKAQADAHGLYTI